MARWWRRPAAIAVSLAAITLALPTAAGEAQPGAPQATYTQLAAQARRLARQIDSLTQQYDGLRVRLSEARGVARAAATTAGRDAAALRSAQTKIAALAAERYEAGGAGPVAALITSSDPRRYLGQASITYYLQAENAALIKGLLAAQAAASRARQAARQQARQVASLLKQLAAKRKEIQRKVDVIQRAAYAKALAASSRTPTFPVTAPAGDSIGARALKYALTRQGDPYVWGAEGPSAFDCSGLVSWAYAQAGITLPHYTGAQWNAGVHVPRDELQPGDIVFFYSDLSHDGLYVGDGLMIDAPNESEPVRVEPMWWNVYAGAVRVAA